MFLRRIARPSMMWPRSFDPPLAPLHQRYPVPGFGERSLSSSMHAWRVCPALKVRRVGVRQRPKLIWGRLAEIQFDWLNLRPPTANP